MDVYRQPSQRIARFLNDVAAWQQGAGVLSPSVAMTLEVAGRPTRRTIAIRAPVAGVGGEPYLAYGAS